MNHYRNIEFTVNKVADDTNFKHSTNFCAFKHKKTVSYAALFHQEYFFILLNPNGGGVIVPQIH